MPRKRLGELLIESGVIDPAQLQTALDEQRRWGRPLGRTLIELRMVGEKTLVHVLSQQLKVPAVDLDVIQIEAEALRKLDATFCLEHVCLPFHHEPRGSFLDVAMADPTSQEQFDRIRVRTRSNVRPYLCGPMSIMRHVRASYLAHQVRGHPTDVSDLRFAAPQSGPGRRLPLPLPLQPHPGSPLTMLEEEIPGLVTLDAHPQGGVANEVQQLRTELARVSARLSRTEQLIRALLERLTDKQICSREELRGLISKEP